MKLKTLTITASAAMLAFGISTASAAGPSCTAGTPTAASATWNFQAEANDLFQTVSADARAAENHAGKLQSLGHEEPVSWQGSAYYWQALRSEVNDMGARLCRLEAIRGVLAPWQQTAVDKIAASVRLMANNTEQAILFGNDNQHQLWRPQYQTYVNNLYNEATALTRATGDAVQYAHVLKKSQTLQQDLGVHAGS